jgi:hypothetical protein
MVTQPEHSEVGRPKLPQAHAGEDGERSCHGLKTASLLSKYGNGVKSFRELSMDAFLPLRKAIDEGALA